MKSIVIISVHQSSKNCFSSQDYNGYQVFESAKEARDFIKENRFTTNNMYSDKELGFNLFYLTDYEYNSRRKEIETLFIKGYPQETESYWNKQDDIRNEQRKIDGFVSHKKYGTMTADDYKGSLKNTLTEITLQYINSGLVCGYLGHSARKYEHDVIIEKLFENVAITVDGNEVNKWDVLSTWLTSTDARHFMDSMEDLNNEEFEAKFKEYIPELLEIAYIYSLPEHKGTLRSTIDLKQQYKGKIQITA
jgi:hypothetical protein